jgi:hypothetical protein
MKIKFWWNEHYPKYWHKLTPRGYHHKYRYGISFGRLFIGFTKHVYNSVE